MLIFDSNSKFRNLLNLDIHNFSLIPHKLSPPKLGYPWVMTPLGNALGGVVLVYVYPHYSKVNRVYGL
jgi:formate/nitrite transporter FocA (FNT family)